MKHLIVGNWKMNPLTLREATSLAKQVERGLQRSRLNKMQTILCPPALFLQAVKSVVKSAEVGAQDVSNKSRGAFTGQVSAQQLRSLGIKYVIVGHSERRELGEDDKLINQKINTALSAGLHPILCVGHGAKRGSGAQEVKRIIAKQLRAGLRGVDVKRKGISIVYEPVWAIGTGRAATPLHAREIADYIKDKVGNIRVIYGGSVTAHNSVEFAKAGIEGALVGGASLTPREFLQIINSFR